MRRRGNPKKNAKATKPSERENIPKKGTGKEKNMIQIQMTAHMIRCLQRLQQRDRDEKIVNSVDITRVTTRNENEVILPPKDD